jgi:hypothetical protein
MRNDFKVFDADTHIRPSAEAIRPHLSKKVLDEVPDLEDHREEVLLGMAGEKREPPYRHWYRFSRGEGWSKSIPRILGEAGPREGAKRRFQNFMGVEFPTEGGGDDNPDARLEDMDREGVDVQFIVHNCNVGHPDNDIEMEFVYAQHRFIDTFCGRDPHRLKSAIIVTPLCIEGSVAEINRWGPKPWAVAVHPRDLWSNPFIGRCASHPWAAMRAVAAFFGGGLMDRFPELRYGILESGFGWLPFWSNRMDDQVLYLGTVAEGLQHKMSEYLVDGRFFSAI